VLRKVLQQIRVNVQRDRTLQEASAEADRELIELKVVLSSLLNFQLSMSLVYKYGTIYREVFKMPPTEICQFMNATQKDNLVVYQLLKIIKDVDPIAIHECPYAVKVFQTRQKFDSIAFLPAEFHPR
jgi:hypothetical protein